MTMRALKESSALSFLYLCYRFLIRAFFHDTCVVCKREEIAREPVGAAHRGRPIREPLPTGQAGTERLPYVY